MKCPICVESGLKSEVYPTGETVTLMSFQPWYDEDGDYHSHDGNRRRSNYSCSKGHYWEGAYVNAYLAPNDLTMK